MTSQTVIIVTQNFVVMMSAPQTSYPMCIVLVAVIKVYRMNRQFIITSSSALNVII